MKNREDAQRELRELLGLPERDTTTAIPATLTDSNIHESVRQKDMNTYMDELLYHKSTDKITKGEKQFIADSLKQWLLNGGLDG